MEENELLLNQCMPGPRDVLMSGGFVKNIVLMRELSCALGLSDVAEISQPLEYRFSFAFSSFPEGIANSPASE